MAGLLYKDFVSIKGKTYLVIGAVITLLMLGLRVIYGIVESGSSAEEVVFALLFIISAYIPFSCIVLTCITNMLPCKVIDDEKKNKINDYIGSLPLTQQQYVLSKYLFVAILIYVIFSVETMWGVISMSFCEGNNEMIATTSELLEFTVGLIYPLALFGLLMAAIELPMIFLLGGAKMQVIKNIAMEILGVVVFGVMLFVDYNWIEEHVSLENILAWTNKHSFELSVFNVFSIVIILGLFYCSYRFTCKMMQNRKCRSQIFVNETSIAVDNREVA